MLKRIEHHSAAAVIIGFPLLLMAILLAGTAPVLAQAKEDGPPKPAKLFDNDETLTVTMRAPWIDLERKVKYQGAYPATIEYTDDLGNSMTHEMTVERRGITRQRVCRYPPVKLRFEKERVKGTTFRGQKSLKLVTHCEKATKFEQYYVLEMLAYRMYNLITDYSFRVRPLSVTYVNSGNGKKDGPRFAFLIEDDSDVAKRNNLKKLRTPRITPSQLEPQLSSYFSLFQYMIGNVDWAALSGPDPKECCHNVKLLAPKPLGPQDWIYPAPYDFDSSGLVDADYAAPPNGLPINSVTQRLFRGYCRHNTTLEDARTHILEKKAAILALIENEERLQSGSKKKASKYIGKYFEILEDQDDFESQIISRCRK
jgi:hypothetical protein